MSRAREQPRRAVVRREDTTVLGRPYVTEHLECGHQQLLHPSEEERPARTCYRCRPVKVREVPVPVRRALPAPPRRHVSVTARDLGPWVERAIACLSGATL